MVRDAIVIDARDRDLEAVLRSSGVNVTCMPAAGLSTLAHPAAKQPDVVILDLRENANALVLLAALKRQHPATQVAAVLCAAESQLLLEAMRAGVNEVLIEPLSPAGVTESLGRLTPAPVVGAKMGEVFAFVGAKGGVGATTTAVSVATVLCHGGEAPTLFVDLHLAHGDATLFLGAEPRFSVVDAFENAHRFDASLFKGLVTQTKAGPDLLASADRPPTAAPKVEQVQALLRFASGMYKYVVVDASRSDAVALDGLDSASRIVVVANRELPAVRCASRIATSLRHRYGSDRIRIIVNRDDLQADIGCEDIEKVLQSKIEHWIPSDYRAALQALNKGRPLTLGNHNKLSAAYVRLAESLSGIESRKQPPTEQKRFGWLSGKR